MRVVLADLKGAEGFVHKDTVVGGYGARLRPISGVTALVSGLRRRINDVPSITMGYLAAVFAEAGHEVAFTRDDVVEGDVALVLSSLVDHRQERAWADAARARGTRVGFVGLAASKLPDLFVDHSDFVIYGEPEEAAMRLAAGEDFRGIVHSRELADLDALPLPRWDLLGALGARSTWGSWTRPLGGLPVLASRSCPEFCTYCPHRILTQYRSRSVGSILAELEMLCRVRPEPFVIFRDPLFTQERDRCLELMRVITTRGLRLRFECETRLDRLDDRLLEVMREAGCANITFGVESLAPETLRKVGRRPIPEDHQRHVVETCDRLGIRTVAFYVLGLPADTWESVAATIDFSTRLGSTLAQYKLLTVYPGTPLWKQLRGSVYEKDWERFDGFTPTFTHPNLTGRELTFLLTAAWSRFYLRPSFFVKLWRLDPGWAHRVARRLDGAVSGLHARQEEALMSRPVAC
jgi:anaerobic magnesium-protoporphyrin IX monomethyl ester cyclase